MARLPRAPHHRAALRLIAGVWLGVFGLLGASLPALDARANHSPLVSLLPESTPRDAASALSAAESCELCDLLNSSSAAPVLAAGPGSAFEGAGSPRASRFEASLPALRAQAPARAPPVL